MKDVGASGIKVACGTDDDNEKPCHTYESSTDKPDDSIKDGNKAIVKVLKGLEKKKKRCRIVVLSSFCDLALLIKKHEGLVRATVSAFFFQAHWGKDPDSQDLRPLRVDEKISNYKWDLTSAEDVLGWLRHETIPTFTATRDAAVKCAVSSKTLKDAAEKGHPVAKHLYDAWIQQEHKFFDQASKEDPTERFRPHMDLVWYVGRHQRWAKKNKDALPESFDDMKQFLDLVLYDAIAVLACMLKDCACFDQLFQPLQQALKVNGKYVTHHIIGADSENPNINAGLLSEFLSQLIKEVFADLL